MSGIKAFTTAHELLAQLQQMSADELDSLVIYTQDATKRCALCGQWRADDEESVQEGHT